MLNQYLALLAFGIVGLTPLTAFSADQKPEKMLSAAEEERVVYHISDSSNARLALININNHLRATSDKAKIVVVTNSKGIDFLLSDAQDQEGKAYRPIVQDLKNKGVDFRVCNNTLVSRKIDPGLVIAEAQIVPSGVAEVGRLQTREHFVYIKP